MKMTNEEAESILNAASYVYSNKVVRRENIKATVFNDVLDVANFYKKQVEAMQWHNMDAAPKEEPIVVRAKSKPWVTFEAVLATDRESYEIPEEYTYLHNLTTDCPVDTEWWWTDYEWMPLPQPPKEQDDAALT